MVDLGGANLFLANACSRPFCNSALSQCNLVADFFGLHNLVGGLIVVTLLIGAIAPLIIAAAKVSFLAAALLAPYFAWTIFAAALNARIISMNYRIAHVPDRRNESIRARLERPYRRSRT